MRVGVLRNSSRNDDFEQLAKEKGFSYTVTYYSSADEMAQALQQGKVDAVVSSSLRRTKGERILEEFDTRDFYAMVRKGNTELLDEINYAIDQMNAAEGDWKNALQNKYYTHLENRNLSFTEQEQELIRQYASGEKVLTIACSMDRAPYSYVENALNFQPRIDFLQVYLTDCLQKLLQTFGRKILSLYRYQSSALMVSIPREGVQSSRI